MRNFPIYVTKNDSVLNQAALKHPLPQISIIIPTLNEANLIRGLIERLLENARENQVEIIISDGNSVDDTVLHAQRAGVRVVRNEISNRPIQLNAGAKIASADLLYFLHADTLPPKNYLQLILDATNRGAAFGCFRFRLDSDSPALRFNSFCTRAPFMLCRGGDQSLFVSQALFEKIEGFNEAHVVMEDFDIIRRGRKFAKFHILPADMVVSSRKYIHNSFFRVNISNFTVFALYYLGVPPRKLKNLYSRMIRHPKFERD